MATVDKKTIPAIYEYVVTLDQNEARSLRTFLVFGMSTDTQHELGLVELSNALSRAGVEGYRVFKQIATL